MPDYESVYPGPAPQAAVYSYAAQEDSRLRLMRRYPFVTARPAGLSVLGRRLTAIKIGEGRRQVFVNASHHANEWITSMLVMRYAWDYCAAVDADGAVFGYPARWLYGRAALHILPMVNPDGVDLVTGALSAGPYYDRARLLADRYPQIPFPSGWKANIDGIDLNLQYPAGWENAREIKYSQGITAPGPRDFVGPGPLTAPEARAVYEYTLANDFDVTLSYHTQGRVIYWKYLDYLPPQSYELAVKMGEASGYAVEETPVVSGYAGYKDWFISWYNRPGYTIEAGEGTSPLPLSQFDTIYSDNIGVITQALAGLS